MSITLTDLFCGAGGSSTGAEQVPHVKVTMAANHWRLAVDTHQANHPNTDHDCADISQVDPRRYPPTDILWASPSCTNHSIAKGVKRRQQAETRRQDLLGLLETGKPTPDDTAMRSRATMWDVIRFTEHHAYRAIIVENVVDAADWILFPAWQAALTALGYNMRQVSLNSMHAANSGLPAPQSRDRLYIVAAGRYRSQYVYRCPQTSCRNTILEPPTMPAASIIDWTNTGKRIGNRPRPLADKTHTRIQIGIDRYWPDTQATTRAGHPEPNNKDTPAAAANILRTRTTSPHHHRNTPFIVELRGGSSCARPITDPLATVTASGNHHGLATAPDDLTTNGTDVDVDDVLFRMLTPDEIKAAMAFPTGYTLLGTRNEKIRQAGNAVTPPAARDLMTAIVRTIT